MKAFKEYVVERSQNIIKENDDPENMQSYFAKLPHEQLVEVALHLYYDAARLRRELDDSTGTIR